jgi:hypothetical protein
VAQPLSEGHAQINKKRVLNIFASKDTAEKQRKNGFKFIIENIK